MQDFNNLSNPQQESPSNNTYLIEKMMNDMRFVGLFTIIYGVINCITIIGAIIGVPLIFMGLRIRESADNFGIFNATGDQNALQNAFEKQYKYFNIQKILIIISLVFIVLYLFVLVGVISNFGLSLDRSLYSILN